MKLKGPGGAGGLAVALRIHSLTPKPSSRSSPQVITPDTDCYDNRMISQSCKSETFIDYYFFNITNAEQVRPW